MTRRRIMSSCPHRGITVALALILVAPAARAQDTSAPIVFRSGAWVVRRAIDPMTDHPTCVGQPDASPFRVELEGGSLYISLRGRGGVQAATLRFGEEAPEPLRPASTMEQSIAVVALEGSDFEHVLRVTRLRVVILTLWNTDVLVDLDLHGVPVVHKFILNSPLCRS